MGKKVAFWSSVHGQAATTSNLVAAATVIGMEYMVRALLTHTHHTHSTLESAYLPFVGENQLLPFSDSGMDAVERLVRSGRLQPDNIKDYASLLLKDRLDLLAGTTKPTTAFLERLEEVLPAFLECATRYYDVTLLDVPSGFQHPLTDTVLQSSDLIVVCLSQNVAVLDRFFSDENRPSVFEERELLLLLGRYDKNSKYTATNIARKYGYKKPIYIVPTCSDFLDACNSHSVIDFFWKNKQVPRQHENHFFMQEVRRTAKGIMEAIGMERSFHVEGDA